MKINKNAELVLERRYLAKDEHGDPMETVEGLFRRVADAIASADSHFDPKADVSAVPAAGRTWVFCGSITRIFLRLSTVKKTTLKSPTLIFRLVLPSGSCRR